MGKTREQGNQSSATNLYVDITNNRVGIGTTIPVGQLQVSSGPAIIGAATSTGTASQTLQVTGGAYVSGRIGVGTTNPSSKLDVVGNGNFTGIVTATSYQGDGSQLTGIISISKGRVYFSVNS
jgi:hypothetical protein